MNLDKIVSSLSLKEKIAQMFIMGFTGNELNKNIKSIIKTGLGGIILFADNINSYIEIKNLIKDLQQYAHIPLFISIDQEGGLVERTINSNEKIEYLTPMALSNSGSIDNIKSHTQIMAEELKFLNINMNFSPVLDVNTNKNNPIVGLRAFSNNTDEVINCSKQIYKTFHKHNIIAVGKHFPGHGAAWVDSHFDMPVIDLNIDELENIHIKPFKNAINDGLDAIMIAHVHYSTFNKDEKTPASLSKQVITDYLQKKLNFNGLVISDDMVMGGITNHYDKLTASIKAINAGIDLLVFRDSSDENIELLNQLTLAVEKEKIPQERINESVKKILFYKDKYNILNPDMSNYVLDTKKLQFQIDKIAIETIKIERKGSLIPLNKAKIITILSPDTTKIHHFGQNKKNLSDFLEDFNHKEIYYSLNPDLNEINYLNQQLQSTDIVIFVSYNAILNPGQIELFNSIKKPIIAIAAGIPYDTEKFQKADSILLSFGYKTPTIKALAKTLSG